MKIFLAREQSDKDDYANKRFYGEIGVFYDTPVYCWDESMKITHWCMARKIGAAPGYMYPELTPENYVTLETNEH